MFKWILENSLRNRLLVIIGALVLMAYGAFTLSRTPLTSFLISTSRPSRS